ncbi:MULTISPECIES: sulfurtransferase [Rhodanobacter]|uniref:sulfurtransferase n=1 Tax=Rhodanobacter TaxID=75309 RepID=UPI0003FBE128|nr:MULTISPECIES: sulfurtransferase [Rhodanobacter]TAN15385.1 MAG: sulfurtransferase [Rhodanobacter sp.]UJJ55391.1 sulfurtransferase [Rhodanobacter thiooxydans]
MSIVNISAYKFISLDDLPALRERLLARCEALALKGTILLAPEGINLFLAGSRAQIDGFMATLHDDPRFADLAPKESLSATVPFGRLRVRLKREIITMRLPTIRPEGGRAPAVDAATLQRWLDQGCDDDGREVLLLDTRNDYETDAGRFAQAVDYRLASFTGFPTAIAADRARYAGKTVVSYCTGGIRCEKATLHMRNLGMQHVYQLDGGILNYLEQTDGAHWQGDCFVFDGRGAVGPDLLPTSKLPLPGGERAGVRGHAAEKPASERALNHTLASPDPSPRSSHPQGDSLRVARRGEEANARSALPYWSEA